MTSLAELWLPVLAASVAVFVVSSVVHMVLQYHNGDMTKVPDEDRTLDAIRASGARPGLYRFPYAATMKEMGTPEMAAKLERGPVGILTIMPAGPCAIGGSLLQWFLLSLAASAGIAYVTGCALAPGADAADVFRVAGVAGVLAHVLAPVCDSIWKGAPWRVTFKFMFDGVLYAAATAAVFAAMWPDAGTSLPR